MEPIQGYALSSDLCVAVSARKHKTVEAKRVCIEPGCETMLSRYNHANSCYRHRSAEYLDADGRPYRYLNRAYSKA